MSNNSLSRVRNFYREKYCTPRVIISCPRVNTLAQVIFIIRTLYTYMKYFLWQKYYLGRRYYYSGQYDLTRGNKRLLVGINYKLQDNTIICGKIYYWQEWNTTWVLLPMGIQLALSWHLGAFVLGWLLNVNNANQMTIGTHRWLT